MHQNTYLFVCLFGLGLPALTQKKYLPFFDSFQYQTVTYYILVLLFGISFISSCVRFSNTGVGRANGFFLRHAIKHILISLWLFICTFYLSSFHLATIIDQQIPENLTKKDVLITGKVIDLPKTTKNSSRFYFLIESLLLVDDASLLETQKWGKGKKIRLSWRSYDLVQSGGIKPGERYRLVVRLKKPRGMVNEKGFDYHAWLLRNGVRATGYVKTYTQSNENKNVKPANFRISDAFDKHRSIKGRESPVSIFNQAEAWFAGMNIWVSKVRFTVAQHFDSFNKGYENIAIFKALVIGDKSDVSSIQWNVFSNTGTIHLMAISGLHIGLVAAAAFAIASLLSKLVQMLFLDVSYRLLRVFPPFFSIISSTTYALIAGMSIPTQRAMIVVALINITMMLSIKSSFFRILLIAAVCIAVTDPFSFMQPGFWLSFLAVCILIYVFSGRINKKSWLVTFCLTQIVVFIGLFVILSLLNLPITVSSIPANIIAVPLVSFVILPLLFLFLIVSLFSVTVAGVILSFTDVVFHILMSILTNINDWGLVYHLSLVDFFPFLMVGGLGVLFVLSPKGLCFRPLGFMLLLTIILNERDKVNELNVNVLDVGQGLSVVVHEAHNEFLKTNKKKALSSTMIYDVGAKFSDSFDIGSRILVPFLKSKGIHYVDSLVVSHLDNDHAGGFEGLLRGVEVEQIVTGQEQGLQERFNRFLSVEKKHKHQFLAGDIKPCGAGFLHQHETNDQKIRAANVEVLWPVLAPDIANREPGVKSQVYLEAINKQNNYSCVVLIRYEGITMLIMGDAESKVEKYLLKNMLLPKDVDILVAGHHGSNTSSTWRFVEHVNPKHVIFSSGYKNSYGHPAQKVLERFKSRGTKIYTTGVDGQINIHINKRGRLKLVKVREKQDKPWY